ncbi:LysR family transcriptional regulator [Thomasclavelia spiroformis]|uniref:LysR family transcriptional regulator n=1 Tax=Thomasclavelia spiroformis TaxID=29348 RepID=UPI00241C6723|nr:LysR family transcriptional regulator [Thomasclavelia spiroformis]MBS6116261.1 LysR family transcriptional regulator [Thomasclavelia spiroformis]
MEIRVLRYFLEVAREKNITKAAKHLHISQPTLSKQLKELEQELGKKLFVRSNYFIKLTEEGMLLKKRAEEILELVDKTSDEFKALDEINGGDIHIGCAESRDLQSFIQVLKKLQSNYPNIRFHLYSSATDAVDERLDSGLLDFAIIVQDVDSSKYNFLKIPASNKWGIIARKDMSLAKKEKIKLEDLLDVSLICSRQSLQVDLPKWLGDMQDKLNIIATYDLAYNASIMVREKMGYVLTFNHLIYTGEDSDLCFRPLEPALESPMYIVWKKHQVFSPIASLLLKELQNTFGEKI